MDTTFSGTGNSPPQIAARQFTIALLVITGLALAVRLIHVNAPILGYQSWRQADTAAIARNFYRNGFHFLSPQIDWGGWSDGRVECELPIYPFVVAMLYKVFGLSEWVGRALSALAGALTVWIFGQLVRRESDERTALWAAGLFSFLPLAVYFTRTFQPESTMVCALVGGVFAFSVWSDGGRMRWLILSGVLISLACLIKIFNLYIGLPLVFLAWRRFGRATFRQWSLWLYAAVIFVPLVLWYRHAHHIFIETGLSFNIWQYGEDKWGNWGLLASWDWWRKIIFEQLAERHLGFLGLLLLVWGLVLPRKNSRERLFDAWLLGQAVFLVVVARGNYVHEYYQLPLLFTLVFYIARVCARFARWPAWHSRQAALVGLALLVMSVATVRQLHRYFSA